MLITTVGEAYIIQWQYVGTDAPGSVPPIEPYVALWDGGVKQVWRNKDNFLPIHINDRGELAGYDTRWEWKAAVWRDDKATLLPVPQDAQSSQATAINNNGMVAGNYRCRGADGLYNLFIVEKTGERSYRWCVLTHSARTSFAPR